MSPDNKQKLHYDMDWCCSHWLVPQLRLDSDEWSDFNSNARIGVSDIVLDATGRWREDRSDLIRFAVALGFKSYLEVKVS